MTEESHNLSYKISNRWIWKCEVKLTWQLSVPALVAYVIPKQATQAAMDDSPGLGFSSPEAHDWRGTAKPSQLVKGQREMSDYSTLYIVI